MRGDGGGDAARTCGVAFKPLINSGLGCRFTALRCVTTGWRNFLQYSRDFGRPLLLGASSKQPFALCASKFGVELLPEEYTVDISECGVGDRPCRHYIGCIRSRMYGEGMAQWLKPARASCPVKVLFAPDWRAGNPYQQLLADALGRQGVEVVFAPQVQGLFRLSKAAKAGGDFDVMHLHWPEAYFPLLRDKRDALRGRLCFSRLTSALRPLAVANRCGLHGGHNLYPHNGEHAAAGAARRSCGCGGGRSGRVPSGAQRRRPRRLFAGEFGVPETQGAA